MIEPLEMIVKKSIISLLLCFGTVFLFGQDICWYYGSEKICFVASSTKFLIQFKKTDVNINDIKNELQHTVAGSIKDITGLGSGLFYIEMQNESAENLTELRRQWSARDDVAFTSPVFGDIGAESGYRNSVIVMIKRYVVYSDLQKLAEDYPIKDIIYFPELNIYSYLLLLDHNPKKDAAQTALELYEKGIFEFTEPNLIWINPWGNGNQSISTPQKVVFYPNPVNETLYVEIEHLKNKVSTSCNILLYDIKGKIQRKTKANGGTVKFDVSNVPDGIYFLHINDEIYSTSKTLKVIVKH